MRFRHRFVDQLIHVIKLCNFKFKQGRELQTRFVHRINNQFFFQFKQIYKDVRKQSKEKKPKLTGIFRWGGGGGGGKELKISERQSDNIFTFVINIS